MQDPWDTIKRQNLQIMGVEGRCRRLMQVNSKWIKDLNIRPETLKLVQKRAGNTLELIGIGNNFLNRTQTLQQLRERIDKWDYMKL
jgi:hypothetical protein